MFYLSYKSFEIFFSIKFASKLPYKASINNIYLNIIEVQGLNFRTQKIRLKKSEKKARKI